MINRLAIAELPQEVTPQISPRSPIGEILRYVVTGPKDAFGNEIYSLNDLRSLQEWTLERTFRRIPGIADVTSFGGTVKRYEIQPDPNRMKRYGITLTQLHQSAVADSNANVGERLHAAGRIGGQVVRGLGLIGRGRDPMQRVCGNDRSGRVPGNTCGVTRKQQRLREIRKIVISTTNNVPVRIGDIVEGGRSNRRAKCRDAGSGGEQPDSAGESLAEPAGRATLTGKRRARFEKTAMNESGTMTTKPSRGYGSCCGRGPNRCRRSSSSKPKSTELNSTPGLLPPGVKIEPFYDRTDLINTTTETVEENLMVGIGLVTVVLLMFLSNVRSAIIIALNLPLALLFAFEMLYIRGQSANLLSIGAVDFGIVVDSTVILVENVYRVLSSEQLKETHGQRSDSRGGPRNRTQSAVFDADHGLCAAAFADHERGGRTALPSHGRRRVCGLRFAAGRFLLAVDHRSRTVLADVQEPPAPPRQYHGALSQAGLLARLRFCLDHRWFVVGAFSLLVVGTVVALPYLGREFIPPLEEGHIFARGILPVNVSLEQNSERSRLARALLRKYPGGRGRVQSARPAGSGDRPDRLARA